MPRIGAPELIIILVIILILFGASRLPQIGSSFGKAIRGFQKSVKGEDEEKPRASKGKSRKA